MAPRTEAPAEMHFFLRDFKALCMAENATHTLHNLLTLRGAVVHDPHAWSKYLTEAIDMLGVEAEVAFASHHWPTSGADNVVEFLTVQRELYGYVHDQTLRMLNKGMVGTEMFAEPNRAAARTLLADTYEQLGYGSENGTWRSFYLSGATELRDGCTRWCRRRRTWWPN